MDRVKAFLGWLWSHKLKFFVTLFSVLAFGFLLFPFSDLSDLVSAQVSKVTNGQVYLQFDNLRMSVFPETGIAFDQVYLEGQGLPTLKADELVFTPSVSSLIYQKPAGSVAAKGFLKGEIEASLKPGTKSDNGIERQKITLSAKKLSLADIRDIAQLPILMTGSTSFETGGMMDLTFQEQPDMDLTLKIDDLVLPPSNVQTAMGPLTLPDLKLASVELKGRLAGGQFLIEEGLIGKESDELRGKIKGSLGLQIQNRNGSFFPVMGSYSFEIDLSVRKSFQDKANLFLTFIDNFKTPLADGAQYKFKVSGADFQGPPTMGAAR
jgi:type II secretion system protein N